MGNEAFRCCKTLTDITFQEGSRLEKIGHNCFNWSNIEELYIPGTVTEIGNDAIGYCSSLRVVWL